MTPLFRRELHLGLYMPPENMLERAILGGLRNTNCLLECDGGSASVSTVVSSALSVIRYAEPTAIKTTITNAGMGSRLFVYEDGCLVGSVTGARTLVMAMAGRGVITARTDSGSVSVVVKVYRRCACGLTGVPYAPPEEEIEPIGSFLL